MEDVVLKKMREVVGYKGGDGIFTPGRKPISQLQTFTNNGLTPGMEKIMKGLNIIFRFKLLLTFIAN